MVSTPLVTPVTVVISFIPEIEPAVTVALLLEALQVRLNVLSVKVIVEPTHTVDGPAIAGGGAEMEIGCVDTHPNGEV
jgi:hypothetical protein